MTMERHEFPPGEEPTVYTGDLCADLGCDKCPGRLPAGECGADELEPDTLVYCTHWCHRKAVAA